MKTTLKLLGLAMTCMMPLMVFAQDDPEEGLNALIGIRLDAAEIKLTEMGYQLANNSLFKKEEIWWHEASKTCIEITHDSKRNEQEVLSVGPSESNKCPTEGLVPDDSEAANRLVVPSQSTSDTVSTGAEETQDEGS